MSSPPPSPRLYVIDMFCGAGGFSEGARRAGAVVILAIDLWKGALNIHAANHPECEHWCEDVSTDPVAFANRLRAFAAERIGDGGRLHIHASPPCQNLSGANATRDEAEGFRLIDVAVTIISLVAPHSHTIEQVFNPAVIRRYGHLRHRLYKMQNLGVPQTRKRLIVGYDSDLRESPSASMREILARCGYDVRPEDRQTVGAYHARTTGNVLHTRSLDCVSGTVRGSYPRLWRDGRSKILPSDVFATLQTFQADYFRGCVTQADAKRMIANAVPPEFARRLIERIASDQGVGAEFAPETATAELRLAEPLASITPAAASVAA